MKGIINKIEEMINSGNKILAILMLISSVVCMLLSVITHIIYYIFYISNGGYVRQISGIRNSGVKYLIEFKGFVSGDSGKIFNSIIGKIILILTFIAIVSIIVSYFIKVRIFNKFLMGIDILFGCAGMIIGYFVLKNPLIFFLIALISIVGFLLLIIFSKEKIWINVLIFLGIAYLGSLCVFFVLENVLVLIGAVLIFGGLILLAKFLLSSFAFGKGTSGGSGSADEYIERRNNQEKERLERVNQENEKKKEDRIKQLIYEIDTREEGLIKYYKKEFGYGHVDPKVTRAEIDKRKAELKRLGVYR